MSIAKTQELRKAFMGGLAAWITQLLIVLGWICFGAHAFPKKPALTAQAVPAVAHAAPEVTPADVFAATSHPAPR